MRRASCCLSIDRRSTFRLRLRAVSAYVSSLATPVARLAGLVQWSAVRGSAIAADMSKFAASIALHGLSLAVASEMIWSTALVARSCAIVPNKATTVSASVASSWWSSGSTSRWCCVGIWAVALRSSQLCSRPRIILTTYC